MCVNVLKHMATEQSSSDLLMLVKINTSWSQQCFRMDGETPSGFSYFVSAERPVNILLFNGEISMGQR